MFSIFYVYCPFACLLWRTVYLGHLLIFLMGLFLFVCFGVAFHKYFIIFGYLPLIRHISEYILPFCGLSFYFDPTSWTISKGTQNTNLKEHKHPYVHCSIIYNHQDMEAAQVDE